MKRGILFFADRLPPLIGGMEMHARYFIDHFRKSAQFPLIGVVTKLAGQDELIKEGRKKLLNLQELPPLCEPAFVFFNSGRWIERMEEMRQLFPQATFLYRTGGNEISKASLEHEQIPQHALRQSYWVKTLNKTIDILITNSAYTEERLRALGISCPFFRSVGGVNSDLLHPPKSSPERPLTIFSAARFVSYKNHAMLLTLVRELIFRGIKLRVRLAGDGPLLVEMQRKVNEWGLTRAVEFLGALDNEKCCREIAEAHLYMQLSRDLETQVEGGSYLHTEGMGRSILEALTAGTFVLAGRAGALSEIVSEDRGLLVDLDNFELLLDQVSKLLMNLPPRGSFSDQYSWKKIFKAYETEIMMR